MDIATIFGIISGISIIIVAIFFEKGDFYDFWSLASIMIVAGGTISATLIHSPIQKVLGVFKAVIKSLFRTEKWDPYEMVITLIGLIEKRRYSGIDSLEEDLSNIKDKFLRKGVELAISEESTDKVKRFLELELFNMARRHKTGHEIIENMGTYAPAFGMMGTIIGLIMMMKGTTNVSEAIQFSTFDLGAQMTSLLSGMAVALLTTFDGIALANLIFIPIAGKLRTRSEEELFIKEIIIEGIIGIQTGEFPPDVYDKLASFFPASQRRLLVRHKKDQQIKKKKKK